MDVGRQRRQGGGVRREVHERDLPIPSPWNLHSGRQVLRAWVVEPHLSADDHVGEERGRERLGDRF
jgi:hypothetical protein